MQLKQVSGILVENHIIESKWLGRVVKVDCYLPAPVADISQLSLLVINDGQNMQEMGLSSILERLYANEDIHPVLCVAVHAGEERKMEYGIASQRDYLGRGAKAARYTSFVLEELVPFIRSHYHVQNFRQKAIAGFSLGGLTALDILWEHPADFTIAGVFSGSFWWRSLDQDDPAYHDDQHRIMHQRIRNGNSKPGLRFFFQCGNRDETRDRNNNGIIDSIDDTIDLIKELEIKGYRRDRDIYYLEMPEGRHDIPTWAAAMPEFLHWAFSTGNK